MTTQIHRYRMTLRPFSFCTVPKGFVDGQVKGLQTRAGDYGTLAYAEPLSRDDCDRYGLQYIGPEVTY